MRKMIGLKTLLPFLRQYVIVIIASFSVICLSFCMAYVTVALLKLTDQNNLVLDHSISDEESSWITSVNYLSSPIGNLVAALLVDRIGRKNCLVVQILPRIVAVACYAFATKFWVIIFGRIFNGVADGIVYTVFPIYASEVASVSVRESQGPDVKRIRGSLGSIFQICLTIGYVGYISFAPQSDYRFFNNVILCLVVALSVPLLFIPDSPYYLYRQGKIEEAKKVLKILHGSNESAKMELEEYSYVNNDSMSLAEALKNRPFLKVLGLTVFMAVWMQATGFTAVAYNLFSILDSTKNSMAPERASYITSCVMLGGAFVPALLSDKFGRKSVMTCCSFALGVAMLALGTFFYMRDANYDIDRFVQVPLICILISVFCNCAGMTSLLTPVASELFDGRSRGIGLSICVVAILGSCFIVLKFYPAMVTLSPAGTFWIFGVNSWILSGFILFFVPETKGKSFLEIQIALGAVRGKVALEGGHADVDIKE